jgi:outer membrane biogenesis lipoprotein LolB
VRINKLIPFLILALFFGCATVPKPAANETMSVDELRFRLLRTTDALKDFSAEGSITVNTPTMNQSAGFDLSARGTDSVKISVCGPFGITVGAALLTRTEFTAYNALNNTVYRGSPEKQTRMLPFINNVPFELLIGTLKGIHPFTVSAMIDSVVAEPGHSFAFSCSYQDGSFDRFVYNIDVNRITKCTRRDGDGTMLWSVKYWYKQSNDSIIVPEQVEVNVPSKETTLLMEYSSATYATILSALTISYPEDAEIRIVE